MVCTCNNDATRRSLPSYRAEQPPQATTVRCVGHASPVSSPLSSLSWVHVVGEIVGSPAHVPDFPDRHGTQQTNVFVEV